MENSKCAFCVLSITITLELGNAFDIAKLHRLLNIYHHEAYPPLTCWQ